VSGPIGPAGLRPHLRILASAGCGKTYALASRFLALVHRGENPAALMASTFSRMAAAEIRDRVLGWAAEAVLDADERRKLARALGADDLDAAAAERLLGRLVDALPQLQIRTIDSLFAGMTMAFAAELELPPEPRVFDDGEGDVLLRTAIQGALERMDREQALATLESLARGRHRAGVVRVLVAELGGLLALLEESEPSAWDWPEPPAPTGQQVEVLAADLERLAASIDKRALAGALRDDARRLRAALIRGGEAFGEVLDKGVAGKLAAGEDSFSRVPIPAEVRAAYEPVLALAGSGIRRLYARMTHSTRDLLRAVDRELRAEKLRRGVVAFEDLTRALDPERGEHLPLDEVWFRLDARVRHLLLDEFQDTSASQWRALRPLAGEIGAHGDGTRSLFAVGDLKQSIYGWRGGEPGILEKLGEVTIDGGMVDFRTEPLLRSYRSAPQVIDAVNAVFGGIASNAALHDLSRAAAARFGAWFEPHQTARGELQGFARFVDLPEPGDDETADEVRERAAVESAVHHAERLRGSGARIAVLVRRNRLVGRIVARLKARGVPASGVGGGSLLDAEATLATLQALRLAEWPDDTVAAFDLAHSPLAGICGFGPGSAPLQGPSRHRVSAALRSAFGRHGVAAVVDRWRRELDDLLAPREVVRMRQLVEALDRLEAAADRSPGELFGLLRAARIDDPGGEGVTVLNVHQSKGLEYDVVIVTDLGKALGVEASREKVAWRSPDRPAERVPRVTRWVRDGLRWPEVEPLHEDVQERAVLESLCVLYVALTRARSGLEVHLDAARFNRDGREASASRTSASALIRAALPPPSVGEEVAAAAGRLRWALGAETSPERPPEAPAAAAPAAAPPARLAVRGAVRRARRAAPASGDPLEARRFLFELPDAEASERGRAVHACFEAVGWIEDGVPPAAELERRIAAVAPGRDPAWRAARRVEFETALARPAIRAVLARPGPAAEVRREHRFVRALAGAVQEGAIDRLVLHRDPGGRVVAAEVLDFKTGAAADPAALAARHAAQLRAYREVVAAQFGLPGPAVRMWIVAVEAGLVVELDDPVER
jgi:ATP-dependent exoDNAse (exonuclease V) beta subunit